MKAIIYSIVLFPVLLLSQDLTGEWDCNDGGKYYIRQVENQVWWYGDGGENWCNVFHGYIIKDKITGKWADVPSGNDRMSGSLILVIDNSNTIRRMETTGNFGGSRWRRSSSQMPGDTANDEPEEEPTVTDNRDIPASCYSNPLACFSKTEKTKWKTGQDQSLIRYIFLENADQCAVKCIEEGNCQSFVIYKNGKCYLFSDRTIQTQSSPTYDYYQLKTN